MAVNWNWDRKIGKINVTRTPLNTTKKPIKFTLNIYSANCLCAITHNYTDESTHEKRYTFWTFFNDIHHLNRCLGLEYTSEYDYDSKKTIKVKNNCLDNCGQDKWTRISLNTYYPNAIKMAQAFAKAGYKVDLYYKEPKEKKGSK